MHGDGADKEMRIKKVNLFIGKKKKKQRKKEKEICLSN